MLRPFLLRRRGTKRKNLKTTLKKQEKHGRVRPIITHTMNTYLQSREKTHRKTGCAALLTILALAGVSSFITEPAKGKKIAQKLQVQRNTIVDIFKPSPINCQIDGSTKKESDNENKGILETTSVSSLKLEIEVLEANARASDQMGSVDSDEFRMLANQKTRELIDLQFSLLTEALEKMEAESLPKRKSEILEEILHESSKVVAHTSREFREYAKRKRSQLMVLIHMMRLQEEC